MKIRQDIKASIVTVQATPLYSLGRDNLREQTTVKLLFAIHDIYSFLVILNVYFRQQKSMNAQKRVGER